MVMNYPCPLYLFNKEIPDEKLVEKIKHLIKYENASMNLIHERLNISTYKASRYYWKIVKGLW